MGDFSLHNQEIHVEDVWRNVVPARLYEEAILTDKGSAISDLGALVVYPETESDIWWGKINIPLDEHTFLINRERALDYLNTRDRIYVVDGFAGWDPKHRIKVRIICTRPYHALFMHNMLIRPTAEELKTFGEPDYVIYNAGQFPANSHTSHMTSKTSVDLCFEDREFVILGTEYAGEMKKGIFTVMNYIMPKQGVLSMHCSANEG